MSCQAWKCGTYKPAPPVGSQGAATSAAREATLPPPAAEEESQATHIVALLVLCKSRCLLDVFCLCRHFILFFLDVFGRKGNEDGDGVGGEPAAKKS